MEIAQQDHDNIITLIANVKTLTEEVRLMRDDTKEEVKALKANKLDTKEFNDFKLSHTREMLERDSDIDKQLEAAAKSRDEQGKKIDYILKVLYIGLGVLGTIEFVAPFAIKYYLHI